MIFFVFLHCYGFFRGGNPGKSPVFSIGIGKIQLLLPELWSNDPIPACFQNAQKFVPSKAIRPPSLGDSEFENFVALEILIQTLASCL